MNHFQVNALHELSPIVSAHGSPTVSSTALGAAELASAANGVQVQENARYLMVQVEGAEVRLTFGGTTPSATVGIKLPVGQIVYLSKAEWAVAKWVAPAGDAVLQVAQLGRL